MFPGPDEASTSLFPDSIQELQHYSFLDFHSISSPPLTTSTSTAILPVPSSIFGISSADVIESTNSLVRDTTDSSDNNDLNGPNDGWNHYPERQMSGQSSSGGSITRSTSPPGEESSCNNHNCPGIAKSLLNNLNELTAKDKACPAGPTIDQALLVCSNVSKQLLQLLQCTCQEDPHLPFLIAVIISTVLVTYSGVAQISNPPFGGGRSQTTFRPVPLTLGFYEVDDEVEAIMGPQLVLHELRKMKHLQERFQEKFCRGSRSSSTDSHDGGIYQALGRFVRMRLAKTIEACRMRAMGLAPRGTSSVTGPRIGRMD